MVGSGLHLITLTRRGVRLPGLAGYRVNTSTTELTIPATSILGARVESVPVQAGCPKFPGVMEDAHKDAQKVMEIPLI